MPMAPSTGESYWFCSTVLGCLYQTLYACRLRTTLEFEGTSAAGVQAYYDQLSARDNQRAVWGKEVAKMVERTERPKNS